ncbi:type II secretion system secretin GspD [Polynucleobacter paneuropaeus]|nr:type II secretion system secretin GspD [Polynucleobacter paneuropaeus]MBT8559245.1 type II secretion system secretin GspD [Polynucleobacter paneuropaeus]MBT8587252.1 type II secretion system secretin GspD [Polynucleobacter paneuropaeus]MBT8599920.1 type II secretion system secretin GspD [Polynucleobacter paneuropaeus]
MAFMPIVSAQNSSPAESATVTLSFNNADIESVASVVAKTTGQTILVDPQVKGTITLISNKPVTKAKALDSFSTALRTSGFALVETNGIYRVVTQADAKLVSTSVTTGKGKQEGDQIITRVFKLNYESANSLLPVLRPLVSPNNTINAYPGNNTIVVTDYASNIQRISELLDSIDAPTSSDVQTIKLRYAIALDIASMLNKVLDSGSTGGADGSNKTVIMADARSNSLLIRSASPEKIRQIRALVAKLDMPGNSNGNIWVVPLRNAEATKLAVTLRAIVAADAALSAQVASGSVNQGVSNTLNGTTNTPSSPIASSSAGSMAATSALTSSSAPTTGGIIQAEPATNSIIITASEPLYRNLRHVIDQLDKRRGQVYIESIIVEVSSTNAAELGIQWQGLIGAGNQNTGFGGTNFGVGGNNIINLSQSAGAILNPSTATATTVQPGQGLNLGLLTKFNGNTAMSALVSALATTTGTNILSTPNLITLDNEEARIVVGQNIPVQTGSYATTGGVATVNPFTTYNRQDVGLILRVRPQISENAIVKMQIYQEVSSVVAATANASSGPTLNKRDIETNVIIDDGQILVLGGLIDNQYTDSTSGIPYLSQIPIIGALFRSDSNTRTKTNLLVFLRPYILRDKGQDQEITANRMQFMDAKQGEFKPSTMLLPPVKDMPKLEEVTPPIVKPTSPLQNSTK